MTGKLVAPNFQFDSISDDIDLIKPYKFLRPIGSGGGGFVMMALDTSCNKVVAIKKILAPFKSEEMARRCLREIHLLRIISHPNIINLIDAFTLGNHPDLYMVMNFFKTDLRKLLSKEYKFSMDQIRWIVYQLLIALSFLHHRGIIHRDLKPDNLLMDDHATVVVNNYVVVYIRLLIAFKKICDLGLARPADELMTGYVSTRFYRAPEIMLSWRGYKAAVDIWSAGCILSELLTGRVLFPGIDHVHHINLIFELLGTPSAALLDRICGPKTKEYLQMLPKSEGTDFRTLYGPDIPEDALDLLKKMLLFDPSERCSAEEALKHPFFDPVRNPSLEGPGESTFIYHNAFNDLGLDELKRLILEEVSLFSRG